MPYAFDDSALAPAGSTPVFATVHTQGSGFLNKEMVSVVGGTGTPARFQVSVPPGSILTLTKISSGTYSSQLTGPVLVSTDGNGISATLNITWSGSTLVSATVACVGAFYQVGDLLFIPTTDPRNGNVCGTVMAQFQVTAIGAVSGFNTIDPGDYISLPGSSNVSVTGGSGSGLTLDIIWSQLYSDICALPAYTAYNVLDYGAIGDGAVDDTVAIRNAIIAAKSGSGIVYLPAGTYATAVQLSDPRAYVNDVPCGSIFTIHNSNVILIGDPVVNGKPVSIIKGYVCGDGGSTGYLRYTSTIGGTPVGSSVSGLLDPEKYWYVTGTGSQPVGRFFMFGFSGSNLTGIQLRSVEVDGGAGWTVTGASRTNTDVLHGDGWDVTHKCFANFGPCTNLLVFNCLLHNFRGEIIYFGGTTSDYNVINTTVYDCNGSAVSCGTLLMKDSIVGTSTGPVANAVECFLLPKASYVAVLDCDIQYCSGGTGAGTHPGNGVAYLGRSYCNLLIHGTDFSNITDAGGTSVLLAQQFANVNINNSNTFTNVTDGVGTYYPTEYSGEPWFCNNVNINDNSFNSTGDRPSLFKNQGWEGSPLSASNQPLLNLTIARNSIFNGFMLHNAYWSPVASQYVNFTIINNIFGSGAYDWAAYDEGNNIANWIGNVRINVNSEGSNWLGNFTTDLTNIPSVEIIDLASQYFGSYQLGFTTKVVGPSGAKVHTNSAWNTFSAQGFSSDVAVPVWIGLQSDFKFAIITGIDNIELSTVSYTPNTSAVAVTSMLTLTNTASANISSATVTISHNYDSGDTLHFINQNGITGSYSSGILTLSGTTTLANYQTALRSITYSSSSTSALTRIISFQVTDATYGYLSNIAVRLLGEALVAGTVSFSDIVDNSVEVEESLPTGGSGNGYLTQFQRAPDVSGSPGSWANVGSNTLFANYTNSSLSPNTTYWYRGVSTDIFGNTSTSTPESVTTLDDSVINVTVSQILVFTSEASDGQMSIFFENINNSLTFTQVLDSDQIYSTPVSVPLGQTVVTISPTPQSQIAIYGSIERGTLYCENRLNAEAWLDANINNRRSALIAATRAIDNLNYEGDPYSTVQPLQFPRGTDTTVPLAVEFAAYEIAIALLDGIDIDAEIDSVGILTSSFLRVRSTYSDTTYREYIAAGIPSATAWNYLKPYLRSSRKMILSRAD